MQAVTNIKGVEFQLGSHYLRVPGSQVPIKPEVVTTFATFYVKLLFLRPTEALVTLATSSEAPAGPLLIPSSDLVFTHFWGIYLLPGSRTNVASGTVLIIQYLESM
jgi:hypothetical protein